MIKSFLPSSEKLKQLLGKKKIEFDPGINLVMGPNGAGKTSLLKAIGAQCAIKSQGAPSYFLYSDWKIALGEKEYNRSYDKHLGTDFLLGKVEWDGEMIYLFRPAHYAGPARTFEGRGDIEKFKDIQAGSREKHSTGQEVLSLLERLDDRQLSRWPQEDFLSDTMAHFESEMKSWGGKDIEKDWRDRWTRFDCKWGKEMAEFCLWIEEKRAGGRSGVPTLLLDEPDNYLSPTAALKLYTQVIPMYVARGWQIIIVSHNPFSLLLRRQGAKVIEIGSRGYVKEVEDTIVATSDAILDAHVRA